MLNFSFYCYKFYCDHLVPFSHKHTRSQPQIYISLPKSFIPDHFSFQIPTSAMPLLDLRERMFLSGCLMGNRRRVTSLLDHGVDVNCVVTGRLGLLLSVRPGLDAAITQLLLEQPDIDVCKVMLLIPSTESFSISAYNSYQYVPVDDACIY